MTNARNVKEQDICFEFTS